MIESSLKQRSEDALIAALQRLSDAGSSLIQIRTREPLRAATVLRKHFLTEDPSKPYTEWSMSTGFRQFTLENHLDNKVKGKEEDFITALSAPMEQLRDARSIINTRSDVVHYFAFHDPGPHLANNAFALDLIMQYGSVLPTSNVAILFITPDAPLDMLPNGSYLVAELPTPTVEELEETLRRILESTADQKAFTEPMEISDDEMRRIAVLGLGLTHLEFETHVALSIIEASNDDSPAITADYLLRGVANGKTEVVKQSEILELTPEGDIANVGGMHRLKDWIDKRAGCYSEEAKEFGIEPPKGLVLVGVPGTGKSLVAKAVASVLGVPLVRLDFARVFSKYVGDSEQRVRSALKMVEDMAPCVLFVDEIDKGLGGIGSGGDSGTSMRVLGTYLTWLQELSTPVFNMVTANRTTGLPPELLRRGRFDQIFSVGLPSPKEREEVLAIHLRKRGRDIKHFKAKMPEFIRASEGYVPAEIEGVVKDGLISAYFEGEEFNMDHIVEALENLVPLSRSNKDQIDAIVKWATQNAIPVNYDNDEPKGKAEQPAPVPSGRRLLAPRRKA